jgi:putative MATE family efflux protein
MQFSKIKSKLIGDRHFYARVVAIVVPIIVQQLVTNVVNLLDNVMVGRVGTLEMSAVAIVNQLIFIFNLCIFGGLAGAGIFSTQYAGAKDYKGVRYCFRVKFIISILMVVLSLIVFLQFSAPLISMYFAEGTSAADAAATLTHATNYLNIMLFGLLPFAISQVFASTLREMGETRLPMIASISAIIVNLVFNYILIFGHFGFPKLGVSGAAIATVMSRYVEMLIIVIVTVIRRKKYVFIQRAFKSFHVPKTLCKQILFKGMPLLVNEFLWSAGMAILLQCYSARGLSVVAAINIANTVNNLFNVVFLSMGNAVSIILGQHLGANEIKEAKSSVWKLIAFTEVNCLIIGIDMALLAPLIPQIYNTEPDVKLMATKFLFVAAGYMPIYAFAHNCYFTIRSGGRTGITFLFDSVFTWGAVVPLAFVLANYTHLPILPLYMLVQGLDVIKCAIGFWMIKKGIWVRNLINNG